MNNFSSAFATKMDAMLEFRVARGFSSKTHLSILKKFDAFCSDNFPAQSELTDSIVHDWLDSLIECESDLKLPSMALRELGKYLAAIGEDAYILPERFLPKKSKPTHYVFTDAELTALFREIDRLETNKREPFLNEIAPVMFRLIYTCGLRPNEGRELLTQNVNLETGEILITNTKQKKERIVVMSDDMLSLSKTYDNTRTVIAGNNPYFFPSNNGGALANTQVWTTLNKAWTRAVSSPENPVPQSIPVYALRHRFASACLNRWLDEGRDLMNMLPYLRTYMGHGTLSETAYYIHILPENLIKSPGIDWAALNDILPEVIACPD